SLLPLYSEPYVKIRIEPTGHKYKLPKGLLCQQSIFFAAAFNGSFQEGEKQFITLKEEEDIVSIRSFELLVQWIYIGRVIFDELPPEEAVTTTIEFVRLTDIYKVTGMESLMAKRIKALIVSNPSLTKAREKKPATNIHCLISKHIISGVLLPKGHPVRSILALAAVPGYLSRDDYLSEALEIPDFAVNLLHQVRAAINSFEFTGSGVTFLNTLSNARINLPYKPPPLQKGQIQ
ncbi:uncharacterized protein K444DRAFT_519241, partial [Hyaloscypha bicolor E]